MSANNHMGDGTLRTQLNAQREAFRMPYLVGEELIESRYNHVHHASSLKLLELARLEYLKAIGFPNERFMDQGLFLVISRLEVDYLRELKPAAVTVTCEEPTIVGREVRLRQRILNERNKSYIRALVVCQFLSKQEGRAVDPPDEFVEAFVLEKF